MKSTESAETEVQKITAALGAALRAAQLRQSVLEARLGWSAGYLSRLLGGSIDLKIVHLAILMREVGLPLELFFAIAAREDGGDLVELYARALAERRGEAEPAAGLAAGDLDRQVNTALRRSLTRMLAALDEPAAVP
jgi:transcriptional regulator with XRE-family HTH domain